MHRANALSIFKHFLALRVLPVIPRIQGKKHIAELWFINVYSSYHLFLRCLALPAHTFSLPRLFRIKRSLMTRIVIINAPAMDAKSIRQSCDSAAEGFLRLSIFVRGVYRRRKTHTQTQTRMSFYCRNMHEYIHHSRSLFKTSLCII